MFVYQQLHNHRITKREESQTDKRAVKYSIHPDDLVRHPGRTYKISMDILSSTDGKTHNEEEKQIKNGTSNLVALDKMSHAREQ